MNPHSYSFAEFLNHSPCLKTVSEDYKLCASKYHDDLVQSQLQESANNHTSKLVCCSFREYVACSESVVYKKCGLETALFTRKFMHKMTLPMIKEYCEKSDLNHECEYKQTGSAISGGKPFSVPYGILIWLVMLVKLMLFK